MKARLKTLSLASLLTLAGLLGLAKESSAAVTVTPRLATEGDTVTIRSDKPGRLHWGVNGWRRPAPADLPRGSRLLERAAESPLEAAGQGWQLELGPFDHGRVHELNFVVRHDDGTWGRDLGSDFRVVFQARSGARRPITIGPGPRLGETAGQVFHEQFQDWQVEDLRALDRFEDGRRLHDGHDSGRDLVAFYSRRQGGDLMLRADLFDIALGAEQSQVSLIVLIDAAPGGQTWIPELLRGKTGRGWELAIVLEDQHRFKVLDQSWAVLAAPGSPDWRGAWLRSDLDAVELGLSTDLLRRAGWDGRQTLGFQVISYKPGHNEVTDAIGETNLFDGRLDESIRETDRAPTAKYSAILHGNQHIKRASEIHELIRNDHIKTPSGHPTGYHRALATHEVFDSPVNIHVSATLAAGFEWADHRDGAFDGPSFNRWIRHLVTDRRCALVGGVFAEHIAPFFENSGVNEVAASLKSEFLREIYGTIEPRIYWTPERVIRGSTFRDIRRSGYEWTVIDQQNHLWTWFGKADALSRAGHKINRINGVNCFVINDDADQKKFWNSDGGAHVDTRRLLLDKALDRDQQQLTLVFDDWEAYAGRSFTSFGVGNDNPDNYNRHVRWIANHPWIQVVTLDEVASWQWRPVERGTDTTHPMTTYHWLNHATQTSYESWYYGSAQEEAFNTLHPPLRHGRYAAKAFGDVWSPGTLFHDCWQDVRAAPAGNLKRLAEATYCAAVFETAWHDEDMSNYHHRDGDNRYLDPDTTYDRVSGWSFGMHNKVRDASIISAAAHWAASAPSARSRSRLEDIDQDGEVEAVLSNDRIYAVFENDGGRLIFAFARDPASGDAWQVLGAPVVDPGARRESELEGDFRVSTLRDTWAEQGGSRYLNAEYSITRLAGGLRLRSDDGRITKTVQLADGADRLTVRYDVAASVGTLYVRHGLSPNLGDLLRHGARNLRTARGAGRFALTNVGSGATVLAALEVRGAGLEESPLDGASDAATAGRNAAMTRAVETAGRGRFELDIILRASR